MEVVDCKVRSCLAACPMGTGPRSVVWSCSGQAGSRSTCGKPSGWVGGRVARWVGGWLPRLVGGLPRLVGVCGGLVGAGPGKKAAPARDEKPDWESWMPD